MGLQDRDYIRHRHQSSRPPRPANPWANDSYPSFRLSQLIGFVLIFGVGFVLGAVYGDSLLRLILSFA